MNKLEKELWPGNRKGYQAAKRIFDVLFCLASLLLLWPFMLIIALLVHLQDGGSVLYSQIRLGRYGKPIRILKFRSMTPGAEKQLDRLTEAQLEQYRREFKIDDDPRVTRLGAILRKTCLDELPQLFNILKGEMSVVGPRPIVPEEISCYTEGERELFQSVPPGLTGLWQACSGPGDDYATGGRQRMELHYARHATFGLDVRLIFSTFGALVRKTLEK